MQHREPGQHHVVATQHRVAAELRRADVEQPRDRGLLPPGSPGRAYGVRPSGRGDRAGPCPQPTPDSNTCSRMKPQPGRNDSRTARSGLSTLRSTRQMLCQVPEREPAAQHRDRGVRRHEGRHHVGAAVARRAVPVPPAVVGGQQVVERREQVVVAAGAGLEDRDARGGVRHEHVQQPVLLAGDERGALPGQVVHDVAGAGADLERLATQGAARPARPWRRAARRTRGGCRP